MAMSLWNESYELGFRTRQDEPQNGLKNWLEFCELYGLDKKENPIYTWKLSVVPNFDFREPHFNQGENHFIYQIWRMCRYEPANLCRVLQVAYNIGQWNVNNSLSRDINDYVEDYL